MQRLFWADLFCWMGLMGQMMYCSDYVATVVYGGSPDAETGSIQDNLFDEGVRMGSFGMLFHSIVGIYDFIHCYLNQHHNTITFLLTITQKS